MSRNKREGRYAGKHAGEWIFVPGWGATYYHTGAVRHKRHHVHNLKARA